MSTEHLERVESATVQSKFKKSLWYSIPIVLLIILLLAILFNYQDKFTLVKILNGFNSDFVLFLLYQTIFQFFFDLLHLVFGTFRNLE